MTNDLWLPGRFAEEFVANRKRALERFLNRTAAHEELSQSDHFKLFLEADDATLKTMKEAEKQNKQSLVGGIRSWANEAMNQISTSLNSTSTLPKTQADVEFEEICAYIDGLEPQMQVGAFMLPFFLATYK
jgi:hypothetical protein